MSVPPPSLPTDLLSRQGSTTELRLLAAEFAYLDQQLAALASQLCTPSSSSSSSQHGGWVRLCSGGGYNMSAQKIQRRTRTPDLKGVSRLAVRSKGHRD